jgi:hypothetical protein
MKEEGGGMRRVVPSSGLNKSVVAERAPLPGAVSFRVILSLSKDDTIGKRRSSAFARLSGHSFI